MKFYRMSKGETAHYSSFEELRAAWNLKPVIKQTKDKEKLNEQRERFLGKKRFCAACKQPMNYISGTNVMVCQNENCKGVKHETKNDLGETKIWYTTPRELLDEESAMKAESIFTDFN